MSDPADVTKRPQRVAFKPERIFTSPKVSGDVSRPCDESTTDTDGIVVYCAFWSGHDGPCRFIRFTGVQHRCGECGELFEIAGDDPHWRTGRGPICPKRER